MPAIAPARSVVGCGEGVCWGTSVAEGDSLHSRPIGNPSPHTNVTLS